MEFEVTGLLPGSTYTIAVRAKNKFGTSEYDNDICDDSDICDDTDDDIWLTIGEILKLREKSTKTKFVWICEPWKETFLAIVSR